mmetsp:Transcript_14716/g.34407  ORF Transcript_14716/g.34407 Transcript_14716/m.34407 type:complete len:293 (+) Transcript_14716:1791-2669(+)
MSRTFFRRLRRTLGSVSTAIMASSFSSVSSSDSTLWRGSDSSGWPSLSHPTTASPISTCTFHLARALGLALPRRDPRLVGDAASGSAARAIAAALASASACSRRRFASAMRLSRSRSFSLARCCFSIILARIIASRSPPLMIARAALRSNSACTARRFSAAAACRSCFAFFFSSSSSSLSLSPPLLAFFRRPRICSMVEREDSVLPMTPSARRSRTKLPKGESLSRRACSRSARCRSRSLPTTRESASVSRKESSVFGVTTRSFFMVFSDSCKRVSISGNTSADSLNSLTAL